MKLYFDWSVWGGGVATGAPISILLDNQAVVGALRTEKTSSCLLLTRNFHEVAWKTNVEVNCVPGHSKISENEKADAEALAALHKLPAWDIPSRYITLAHLQQLIHRRRWALVDEWWSTACSTRYLDLDLQKCLCKPSKLSLPRNQLHKIIATMNRHGDFAAYHYSFHHNEANFEYVCGQKTSQIYFVRRILHLWIIRKLRNGSTTNYFVS